MLKESTNTRLCLLCAAVFLLSGSCTPRDQNNNEGRFLEVKQDKSIEGLIFSDVSNDSLNPREYRQWVIQHCLMERTAGEIYLKLLYKPYDYIICLETGDSCIKACDDSKLKNELDGMEYFDLRVGLISDRGSPLKHNLLNQDQYSDRVKYYAFQFQNDISLITTGGDTIHPQLFHFERAYDLTRPNYNQRHNPENRDYHF